MAARMLAKRIKQEERALRKLMRRINPLPLSEAALYFVHGMWVGLLLTFAAFVIGATKGGIDWREFFLGILVGGGS